MKTERISLDEGWKNLIEIYPFSLCDEETVKTSWLRFQEEKRQIARETAHKRIILLNAINHLSYDDLSALISIVKKDTDAYSVLTRHDLENTLLHSYSRDIKCAALLLEKEGMQETMLYLLGIVHYKMFGPESVPKLIRVRSYSYRSNFFQL